MRGRRASCTRAPTGSTQPNLHAGGETTAGVRGPCTSSASSAVGQIGSARHPHAAPSSNGQMRCLFPRSRAPARGMLRGALSRCFCRHGTRRPRGGQPAAAMAAGGAAAGEEQVGRAAPRRERGGGGGGAARGSRPRARRRPAICPRVDALCSSSSEPLSGQCAARGGGAWGAARAPAGGAAEGRLLPSACGACERPSVGLRGEGRGEHARTRTDAMSRVASCPSGAREPHTKQRLRGAARCVCTK